MDSPSSQPETSPAQATGADTLPDPGGPPKRALGEWFESLVTTGLVVYVAAGVVALAVGTVCTPTMGATRSSRLAWERREAEIEAVAREAEPGNASQQEPADAR